MSEATFINPVLSGFHPDPSICEAGGRFFLVTSSFEYFPGLPLYASDDLVTWDPLGHVLDRPSQLNLAGAAVSGGIYAPTIRFHEGTFYVVATNVSNGGHFLVTTTDPAGPWSDPLWIDQNGIDPSLYFENDTVYFTSNVQPDPGGPHAQLPDFVRGIQQSLIDVGTGALIEPARFIWAGTGGRYPEAPHLFRRGDWHYLLIAEGGTEYGHIATIGRSRSPWGPFEPSPHGPVIDHRSIPSPFQAMGHADFVRLPSGEWWAVCLGIRPIGGWPYHILGRETFLAPVVWRQDDWPVVGDRGRIDAVQERPKLPPSPQRVLATRDDFSGPELRTEWTFVRAPLAEPPLDAGSGGLTLKPAGRGIDSEYPCFVGRRQQHHEFVAATSLSLDASEDEDEAGLMVRMNDTHFYAIGVRRVGEATEVILRQRFGHIDLLTPLLRSTTSRMELRLAGDALVYRFGAESETGEAVKADPVDVRFISTEVAGGFTGAFIGPYATSRAESDGAALFHWFDYEPR